MAGAALEEYKRRVPKSWHSDTDKQTCVAAVCAQRGSRIFVVGLGVGTKFPSRSIRESAPKRVIRDCHAEVLARRAFKRHLALEISCTSSVPEDSRVLNVATGHLLDGTTLHFYSSSAPLRQFMHKKVGVYAQRKISKGSKGVGYAFV